MKYRDTYKDCLSYINSYWDKITKSAPKDDFKARVIGLPKPYLVPNNGRFPSLFYWDSYFMMQGILDSARQNLALDIIENFAYLFEKFNIIPNIALYDFIDRSQPPFLSSMIMDVFHNTRDKKWLGKYIKIAKAEYETVWTNEDDIRFDGFLSKSYHHRVKGYLLSRYGDHDTGYAQASELESGWDFTSRFHNRCNEFLPIDLNSYLFKYESDFIEADRILGSAKEKKFWEKKRDKRLKQIQKLMWNEEEGFFFDYNYSKRARSDFFSLAGFVPLWAKLATKKQAKQMLAKLSLFESKGGLVVAAEKSTQKYSAFALKQWDWPNIWPPLEYLTVVGLLNYGFKEEATHVMKKSLAAQATIFRKYGTFFEKMDGMTLDKSPDFLYENQRGFGWTNGVFYRYVQILDNPQF